VRKLYYSIHTKSHASFLVWLIRRRSA
jgi:hypothetical protein